MRLSDDGHVGLPFVHCRRCCVHACLSHRTLEKSQGFQVQPGMHCRSVGQGCAHRADVEPRCAHIARLLPPQSVPDAHMNFRHGRDRDSRPRGCHVESSQSQLHLAELAHQGVVEGSVDCTALSLRRLSRCKLPDVNAHTYTHTHTTTHDAHTHTKNTHTETTNPCTREMPTKSLFEQEAAKIGTQKCSTKGGVREPLNSEPALNDRELVKTEVFKKRVFEQATPFK